MTACLYCAPDEPCALHLGARKTYRLPKGFYYDHRYSRECGQTGVVVKETSRYYDVSLDDAAYDDLRTDCEYHLEMNGMGAYSESNGGMGGMGGMIASARATLKRLQADPMGEPAPPEKRRYTFSNPGTGYPRTITATATSEDKARRIIAADLPFTAEWPLERNDVL